MRNLYNGKKPNGERIRLMEKIPYSAKKIISLACAFAVSVSAVGVIAFTAGANNSVANDSKTNSSKSSDTASVISGDDTIGKEETVYVIADAEGNSDNIIVSDWLKNPDGKDTISDKSNLENIENVKGDEEYKKTSDGKLEWAANGNDIYYQGKGKNALPVSVKVSYTLDGKKISPDELAGKSGKVTIRFDYTNNQKETVTVNGEKKEMYVPFVMMTGAIFDNDVFKNVTVTNGKVINDGDRCVVMGIAMPGMNENLGLDKDTAEIPDYIEIKADADKFELLTTLTVATNSVFNKIDLDSEIDSVDGLEGELGELTDAMNQLVNGSGTLYDGLSELLAKSSTLTSGIDKLYSGAKTLSDGTGTLKSGTDSLKTGADALAAGLNTLTSKNKDLVNGAKQVFTTLLSSANEQLAAAGLSVPTLTIDNYKSTLNKVVSSLDKNAVYQMAYNTALSKVTEQVNANEATIKEQVTQAVLQQVTEAVLQQAGKQMSYDDYQKALSAGLIDDNTKAVIDGAVSQQMNSDKIQGTITATVNSKKQELIDSNMKSAEVTNQINAAVEKAQSGKGSIETLIKQLDSYNEFYTGLIAYTNGVSDASTGAGQLQSGSAQLQSGASDLQTGAKTLYDGVGTLKTGSAALIEGIQKLKDGSKTLSDGIKQFRDEGINKIVEAINGDLKDFAENLKATVEASKKYQSYSGKLDSTTGNVKFIIKTDSIG